MESEKVVLVVDDSQFDRELLVKALSKKGGFKTIQAKNSEECVEIVQSQKVDLILMDILMPGTFGTQTLQIIRKKYNPIELPIIMITAKADATDVIEALQLGANDYITKPVNFEVAITRISTHLKFAEVSKQMTKLNELAVLDAMIATYNHEINNPLSIAIGCLSTDLTDEKYKEKLKTALWRIADIVKQIRTVTEKREIEYQQYVGSEKIFKVK